VSEGSRGTGEGFRQADVIRRWPGEDAVQRYGAD